MLGYGRVALQKGLGILGLQPGDTVLLPDYICHSIMPVFRDLGINIQFYGLDSQLAPHWDDLRNRIDDKTRALMVVNYFGFPQDLRKAREICDRHGIFLVEDNAHGFLGQYKGQDLGCFGDISITSFYKTLSVPNGAYLQINHPVLRNQFVAVHDLNDRPKSFSFVVKQLCREARCRWQKTTFCGDMNPSLKEMEQESTMEGFRQPVSFLTKLVLERIDEGQLRSIRRTVYERWLYFLKGCSRGDLTPIFTQLPEGVVPYVFPVIVEDRCDVMKKLCAHGIESFPWPFLPRESGETYFSSRVICLPVFPLFNPVDYLDPERF